MKAFQVAPDTHVLVIAQGEKVIASIEQFCAENSIVNASLSGLGAVDEIRCGYYDLAKREYTFKSYTGLYEVLQLSGNVMRKESDIFVHLHATFSDEQNRAFGGHVEEMRVGVTVEIVLQVFQSTLKREFDDETGLFLISDH